MALELGLTKFVPGTVYIVSIAALLLTIFYRTEIGVYFLVFLLPLQNVIYKIHEFPLGDDIVDIFLLILLLCLVFKRKAGDRIIEPVRENRAIFIYIVLTYIYLCFGSFVHSVEFPINPSDPRFMNWKNHVILPLLFLVVLNVIHKRSQINFLLLALLFSIFFVCVGFKSNLSWVPSHYSHERRGVGVFVFLGPNEMAAFFSTYMFMVLGLLIKLKGFSKKLPLGFLFFFCLWCLLFSYSRGAYVAALGGLVFIGALFNRKILVLLIVASFFWKSIVPISVVERIEMTTSEVEHAGSSSESRLSMWQHGIKLFLKNPIGYGLDSVQFLGFRKNYSVIDVGEFRMKRDTHNKYIEFLVEMGLIGISLFLYLFYLALKRARAVYTATGDSVFGGLALGFAASIVSLMIVNLFGDRWTYIPLAAFFWVLWALTTRSFLILQQETASDSTDTQYLNP